MALDKEFGEIDVVGRIHMPMYEPFGVSGVDMDQAAFPATICLKTPDLHPARFSL